MIKLFIDGKEFTDNANLDSISTIIGLNKSNDAFNLETSGLSIELDGPAAQFIKETYIDNCLYPSDIKKVIIMTDAGDFNFNLLPNNATWCNNCTASILLSSDNDEELCYNRLKLTKVLNDDFWNYLIGQKKYRIAVTSQDISTFNAIAIDVINIISIIGNLLLPAPIRNVAQYALWGTGRWNPVIKINTILEYYAKQCGRTFKSTILQNDPFNRMYILPAVNEPGKFFGQFDLSLDDTDKYRIDMTVEEFLNVLGDLFYADWRITPTEIVLYPKERILESAVNVGELNPIEQVCLTPINNNCGKLELTYNLDYVDNAGDSEFDLFNHIEDFNLNNRALSEICKVSIPTSVAINTSGRSANKFVRFKRAPGNNSLIDLWDFLHKELLLSNNRSGSPKFMINSEFAENNTAIIGNTFLQDTIDYKGFKVPNYQLSFNRDIPDNLYDRIHYKRNPANGYLHCLEEENLTVCFDTTIIENMRIAFAAGNTAYFTSEYGNIYFTEAEVIIGTNQRIILNNIKIY